MIKAIAKSNFSIFLKNISLATVLVLGLSQAAKADETKSYQDLRISCDPAINQDSKLNCSFNELAVESELDEATKVAQGRRGRRRKSRVQGYYGGFTGGVGFASGTAFEDVEVEAGPVEGADYGTSFDGSIFGGIKFTDNISADLEFFLALGGLDTDGTEESLDNLEGVPGSGVSSSVDGDFSAFALYINPRFELPLNNKISFYASPGIGLSQTNVNFNADINIEGEDSLPFLDEDASNTGISFQIKAGAEYQITDTIDIVGQARYVTLPTDDEFDSINIFGLDAGLKFNF